MNRKTIVTTLLVCISLCVPLSVFSQDFEINGTVLVKYRGNATNVTIPAGITAIGSGAFAQCKSLTSITIPASVTVIGRVAFNGCSNLSAITIPDSVMSIGEESFEGTAWLNNQPDGLVYAGKVLHTYKGTMPANTVINSIRADTIAIGVYAFKYCTNLAGVIIPSSVTSIGGGAFSGCANLTSITIPNSVTSIGVDAFSGCANLTSLNIPKSVTSILSPFFGCSNLTSIIFEAGSAITSANFGIGHDDDGFGFGNLKTAYLAGGAGTYTRAANGDVWTKQR